ncbi:GpE family phage tail protein [Natronospirillum operosum]|uniref:GpE family phage tail protein n=1 Tax=Natronospirillum operosum TaxID=2759953 RepID=A0A4Z0WEE6_9GAMM|nr:GpE family phage tail protein [Natronospirillum operosum]TGG92533.1 GpE family phage tail protein [Natronospirillum operosum]
MVADIAFIFHWQPDWLLGRGVSELMDWHEKATTRHQQVNGGQSE